MSDRLFGQLERSLQQAGIAPRYIRRTVMELQDHFDDLRRDAADDGCDSFQARERALREIGDQRWLASQIISHSELKSWPFRHPAIARVCYPLAYLLLLPAAPLFAGAARASLVARWGAAVTLSATVTAAMLLAMQLSISLA